MTFEKMIFNFIYLKAYKEKILKIFIKKLEETKYFKKKYQTYLYII